MVPWAFLSSRSLVVSGPTIAKLTRLGAKIVRIGASTHHLFPPVKTPRRLDGGPRGDFMPGYVSASTAGRKVCREK